VEHFRDGVLIITLCSLLPGFAILYSVDLILILKKYFLIVSLDGNHLRLLSLAAEFWSLLWRELSEEISYRYQS
jgi:hypothetical protein